MRHPTLRTPGLAGTAATLLLLWPAAVWADLMLFPTRVTLEKNQRAAQVELINQGSTAETYRISLVNRRMGEHGEFFAVDTPAPGERFAEPLLRYSPRQVTVPPGGSQTVRILLRKPADLPDGEYRSHLQFDRLPDPQTVNSVENGTQPDAGAVGVRISALVGASIPVIVRQGDTQAQVGLSELALLPPAGGSDAAPAMAFRIDRSGNRSVYGDLLVRFTPAGGAPVDVAKAAGVAVYVPNAARRARLPLQLPPDVRLAGGTLRVSLRERVEAGGRLLAEASLTLP